MPLFRYTYLEADGSLATGTLEAESLEEAALLLRSRGVIPIEVARAKGGGRRGGQLKNDTVAAFFRQLRALLRTGRINAAEALRLLEEQIPPRFRKAYSTAAHQALTAGVPISQALQSTGLFPPLALNLLRVGEASGKLEETLDLVYRYYQRAASFARKLRGALTYPVIVLLLAVAITWALMVFVVPQFTGMLREFDAPLPPLTKAVMAVSSFLSSPFGLAAVLGGVGGAVYAWRWAMSQEDLRRKIEPRLLRLPVVGPLMKYSALSTLARTTGVMYQAGIQIHEALEYVRKTMPLVVYGDALKESRRAIALGNSISSSWSAYPELFPPLLVSLTRIGEETGQLDEMLEHAASFYEEEAEGILSSISSVVEPLLLVFVGGLIAVIMLSVLLPYFKIAQSVGGF